MKNSIKKIMCVICLCTLVISLIGNSSFAKPNFDIVKAKTDLVNRYKSNYTPMSPEETKNRAEKIDRQLCKLIAEGKSQIEIDKAMEINKIYKLEVPADFSSGITPMSEPNDAICNPVSIYYDSAASQWVVSGGGSWTSDQWFNDRNWIWVPYTGETHNVGGYDSVGIAYNNTSGIYNSSVVSSMGYITDQNGWGEFSSSPSHGDGSLGVAFDFQDKQKYIRSPISLQIYSYDVAYQGKGYSALIRYNSNFANYNGNARVFYAHTWKTCNITNLSFGSGSGFTFGVDVDFSTSNGWKIFSGSDTPF